MSTRDQQHAPAVGVRLLRPHDPVPDGDPSPPPASAVEDYWARVQALREDLARLRPAN